MEFGIEKCMIRIMKEKKETTEEIELSNQESIRIIEAKENNKYLCNQDNLLGQYVNRKAYFWAVLLNVNDRMDHHFLEVFKFIVSCCSVEDFIMYIRVLDSGHGVKCRERWGVKFFYNICFFISLFIDVKLIWSGSG